MVALRPSLHFATIALLYLLPVSLSALWWGRGPSLVTSLLSFLSLNYFFSAPYGTFHVASTQDIISLFVFLFVAETTSRLMIAQSSIAGERLRLQRKAAEAEVLRKTDELKSALLSAVSHDLRTPLASIRIAATGLHHDALQANEDARRELLDLIDDEAERLDRLVTNLLNLSRIEAGALRPDKAWCSLHEVIARAVDHVQTRLRDHRITVDAPDTLPLLLMDFTEIEDVLVNLLDNAARHSPDGTDIRITAGRRDGAVRVQVENQGLPISPDAADRIFDRYYRGQRDRAGFGLGLAICKGLVEAHGGRIWVEHPGQPGARFAFTIPLSEPPAIPTPEVGAEP